ncbi:glycosyltransferase [Ekhidna sp.]
MNQLPLVSIICLCHNQAKYVKQAIHSVWKQSYPNIELIIVDDGSTDGSKEIILELLKEHKTKFINIESSIGNCRAFNHGFFESIGDYIIDLAADDELCVERVLQGINAFMRSDAGVTYCDVMKLDQNNLEMGTHFKRNKEEVLIEEVPEGDIYIDLIKRYFISPPSMMIKREVLEQLNGYDETLSYEDFDFWIRSARKWSYAFTNDVLVKKRILPHSLSTQQFRKKTQHQLSTLKVCQKIKVLNQTKEEDLALRRRCLYEVKQCVKQKNWKLIPAFLKLIN